MNELQVFQNEEFGRVRVVEIDSEPWFVGKDICEVFGDTNHNRSIGRIDSEDKRVMELVDSLGRTQSATYVNESGLYSLLFAMQPKKANKDEVSNAYPIETQERINKLKKFKRWVTSEVLPSIRKHGVYATPVTIDNMIADPDFAIRLLTELKEERKRAEELKEQNEALKEENEVQAQQIAEMNPKATYYDEVLNCIDALPIGILAKDYGWSPQQLNNFLNENKVQYKRGNTWLLYAPYQDKGYTKSETFWFKDKKGNNRSNVQTKWTQKGRLFIYELMKNKGNLPLIEQE